jgi:hypothetical protein
VQAGRNRRTPRKRAAHGEDRVAIAFIPVASFFMDPLLFILFALDRAAVVQTLAVRTSLTVTTPIDPRQERLACS